MQEDLEAEFQSLFSLLEELKEGMLMKIKQDRASRTYELQVCVSGDSLRPLPRCHLHCTPQIQQISAGLMSFSKPAPFPVSLLGDAPVFPVSRARHPADVGLASSFPGLLPVRSLAMTCQSPTHLFSLLIPAIPPASLHCHSHAPTTGCSSLPFSPSDSSFSALPTGPPDLMARHPPWLLWD